MKKGVKGIIVDIGDVLALSQEPLKKYKNQTHHLGVHENVAKKLNVSLDQYFDSIDTAYANSIEGKISKEKVMEVLSKNFKISKQKLKKIYSEVYKNQFKQNLPLLKQLLKLKKQKYKIAILSDQWHLSKEALIPKEISKKFNTAIISCDVGIRKPNPQIYLLAIKRLKLSSSEILFIDNQKWNILPAKKIGMNTILFKNNKQLFSDKKWRALFK